MSFPNISPFYSLPSHSLESSFAKQKFFILMKSSLIIICFMNCTFGLEFKKSLPSLRSFRFSSLLLSRSFIVLHFSFRSVILFEIIFVKAVRSVPRLIDILHVDVQLFQHNLLKRLYFFYCITFAPFLNFISLYLWGSISGLSILFHCSICIFFHQYQSVLITIAL